MSRTVGPEGGTLTLGEARVTIPPDALAAATTVRLARVTEPRVRVTRGVWAGWCCELEAVGVEQFSAPVALSLAVPPGVEVPVGYRVDAHGELHDLTLVSRDPETGEALFHTFVPGRFTWVDATPR